MDCVTVTVAYTASSISEFTRNTVSVSKMGMSFIIDMNSSVCRIAAEQATVKNGMSYIHTE